MVKVKVLEVDIERKRIALSMKTNTDNIMVEAKPERNNTKQAKKPEQQVQSRNLMANAFAKALKK
jgi:protein Tex